MSKGSYYADGRQGGIVLNDLTSANGNFRRIVVLTNTVLSSLEDESLVNASDIEGQTLPAGVTFGGNFKNITVQTGLLIAYYA